MEFLKKRFIDNDCLVTKANKFIPRDHFKNTGLLFLSFLLSFIVCTLMAFTFEGNPVLISTIFLFCFGFASLVNAYYLYKFNAVNNAIEFQNSIYTAALRGDCDYCLVFNDEGEVVYADPRLQKLASEKVYKNLTELESLLQAFKVSPVKAQQVHDIVYREKYTNKSDDSKSHTKHDRSVMLKPFQLDNDDFSITVSNLERPIGFTILKVTKVDEDHHISKIIEDIAVGYYEMDSMGHISKTNDYFAKMLGYEKIDLLNLDTKLETHINKDESMDSLISNPSMENALVGNWQGFLTLKTKYKEHINVFVIQKALYKDDGQIDKVIGYVIKLQNDSLLVKSRGVEQGWIEYSWKCFFANSPYPVTILDKSGLVVKSNQAFVDMFSKDSIGEKFEEIFSGDARELIKSQIDNLVSTNAIPKSLSGIRTSDKKILDVYMGKILDLNGDTYGFMVRIADMSQKVDLENSLSHAQRMQTIGHLVGSVAHDFNNLLTAISGFCDLLLMRHSIGDPSFAHVNQIKQSSDRATNLVQRLLAFSRKQTLKPQIINPSELLVDFSSVIQRLLGTDVNYNKLIQNNIWHVKVDPVQLEQVILNLVVNAHQAIEKDGELTIRLTNTSIKENDPKFNNIIIPPGEGLPEAGDYVCMEVEDSGAGIPKDIVPKIFEPFFTTKAEKSGTGLGLSTVYGIVRQSGGYIYLKTEAGKGTTFYIYFKRHELSVDEQLEMQRVESDKVKEEAENKLDYSGNGVIALVEDEDAVRLFAKSVLVSKGYEVLEYNCAKSAMESIHADLDRVDLIISDVMMPEMTGPAFIKEIRKTKPNIKVIFISGYGEEAFDEEYGNSRDFNFIPKPFKLKQLVAKVKEVIDN